MTAPVLLAAVYSVRSSLAFVVTNTKSSTIRSVTRMFASSLSSQVRGSNISRLDTLQTLLSKCGAPGSEGCTLENDLEVVAPPQDTPELLASMEPIDDDLANVHPYLFPIAKSKATGNLICAYRNPSTEESNRDHPWPIVETTVGGPGMRLLALNSEHLMRRIVCQIDFDQENPGLIDLYNDGLGQGELQEAALDTPYEVGSVKKLGYGVDKYILLRVGPFPDLYQDMARQHFKRGDEQSSLIAAEAANGKLSGFGSTFRFYARLLSSFPNREEETRDAARMCLRMPLPTIGLSMSDFEEAAFLGKMVEESATVEQAMEKIKEMYLLLRKVEEEDPHKSGKSNVQMAIEEADEVINSVIFEGKRWTDIRSELGEIYRKVRKDEFATFVTLQS